MSELTPAESAALVIRAKAQADAARARARAEADDSLALIASEHVDRASGTMLAMLDEGAWSLAEPDEARIAVAAGALGYELGWKLEDTIDRFERVPALREIALELLHAFERAYLELKARR